MKSHTIMSRQVSGLARRPRYWRSLFLLSLISCLSGAAHLASANTVQTRILTVKGQQLTDASHEIQVQPGDVIPITVDEVTVDDQGNILSLQNDMIENFMFRASDTLGTNRTTGEVIPDFCDPEFDCTSSNFEITPFGVNFRVPRSINYRMSVRVTRKNAPQQSGSADVLNLINATYNQYQGGYYPPAQVVTQPSNYPTGNQFDFNVALNGFGNWTYIGGSRVFVPTGYDTDWAPYRHGHWYWTSQGWAWNSFDPWGWVTDHYGYWRHHQSYGWVWAPFGLNSGLCHWHPAVVSWFYNDGYVGWAPYWDSWSTYGYRSGYGQGYAQGYNDGYWDGFRAGMNSSYQYGYQSVENRHFLQRYLHPYMVSQAQATTVYARACGARQFGPMLGIATATFNPAYVVQTRGFVASRVGLVESQITEINVTLATRAIVGAPQSSIEFANLGQGLFTAPAQFNTVIGQANARLQSPMLNTPLGSVINPAGLLITPIQQGRVNAVAPQISLPSGQTLISAPRLQIPLQQVRPVNPIVPPLANILPPVFNNPASPVYNAPVYNTPVVHPAPPVFNNPAPPLYNAPVYNTPAYHPAPPVFNNPAPPVYNAPAFNTPVVRPQPSFGAPPIAFAPGVIPGVLPR